GQPMRRSRLGPAAWGMLVLVAIAPETGRAADPRMQLDKVVDIEKAFDGPANTDLEYLSDRYDTPIVFDQVAFKKEKVKDAPYQRTVYVPKLSAVRLETTLRLILDQLDAMYEIRGQQIVVVPNLRDGKPLKYPPPTDAQKQAQRAMRERLEKTEADISKPFDGNLKSLLDYFEDRHSLDIIIDPTAFKRLKQRDVAEATVKLEPTTAPL